MDKKNIRFSCHFHLQGMTLSGPIKNKMLRAFIWVNSNMYLDKRHFKNIYIYLCISKISTIIYILEIQGASHPFF